MLNRSITTTLAALAIAGASVTAAYASEEALLDALVKKGVLKQADAQKIKAESAHAGSGGNSKIKLNAAVKELSIYGDLGLRWQHNQSNDQTGDDAFSSAVNAVDPTGKGLQNWIDADPTRAAKIRAQKNNQDQAVRFRLFIGTNVKLADDLNVGVELATQDTVNQRYTTIGNGGKDYTVGISKAFVGWHPSKEFSITAGRQSVPFYSTDMVWSSNVRLDGVTEKLDLGSLLGFGEGFQLHLISGQFKSGNNYAFNAAPEDNRDAWLFQSQLKAVADLGGAKLTIAPGFQWSNGASSSGLSPAASGSANIDVLNEVIDAYNNANPGNTIDRVGASTGYLNDLAVILAPGDISFDVAGTKMKFLWDFAYNFDAGTDQRITAPISSTQDRMAWLLGLQVGQNHHKGDFAVFANYREVGAAALNNYYSDPDFAYGNSANQRGFKVGAKYNLTNNATVALGYTASCNIDQDNIAISSLGLQNSNQLITVDLGVKF